jgi:YVTN family beta-propeller protein
MNRRRFTALPAAAGLALCAQVSAAAPFAYVTNAFATPVAASNVTVIDTATNAVSTIINFPAGAVPYAVAMTPDLKKVYVTSMDSTNTCGPATGVYIIDIATQSLESTSPITVGCEPTDIAITPDGLRAYVANQFDGTVSVIDITTGAVSQTIKLGVASNVNAVALTPDGSRAYVTGHPGVFVLDTSTNAQLGSPIAAGNSPYDIAATPDGRSVYVTDDSSPSTGVTIIDVATDQAVKTIAVGNYPSGVAITPDGKLAYLSDNAGGISVIDTTAQAVVGNPIPANGASIAFTADGKQAYVASEGGNTVAVIDTATETVTKTLTGMDSPRGVATRPLPPGFPVPNMVGDTQATATAAISAAGFIAGAVTRQASVSVAPGTVISQSPAAGGLAGSGAPIALVVSSGVAVPNVVAQTQVAAGTAITGAGLTLGTVTQQSSAAVTPGTVISQKPAAGTDVAGGSQVSLIVSSGITVPNVVGQAQAAATTAITGAGLTVGTVTQQSSNSVASGSVISENPAAGTNVAGGSQVSLVVSSGTGGGGGYGGGGGGGSVDLLTLSAMLWLGVAAWLRRRGGPDSR